MQPATKATAILIALTVAALIASPRSTLASEVASTISQIPETLDKNCRDGRAQVYDECSDQASLLAAAEARADRENKTVLVVMGAEWCVWCHVFDAHIHGQTTKFDYRFASPKAPEAFRLETMTETETDSVVDAATKLAKFVSDKFVVLHVDTMYAPGGRAVAIETNAAKHYFGEIPFIFTLDKHGKFADVFNKRDDDAASVSWNLFAYFRGYKREVLFQALQRMQVRAATVE